MVEGLSTTLADAGRLRVCNLTGATADPPNLLYSYFTVAP